MAPPVVYRKPGDPYMGTATSFEKSLAAINKMLERYKVEEIQTKQTKATLVNSGLNEPATFYSLAFRKAGFSFLVEFPVIIQMGKEGNQYGKVIRKLRMDVSARIIHDRLKALLIGVDLGLSDFSMAMMPYLALPDGKGGIIALQDYVIEHKEQLQQGKIDMVMLPSGRP